MKAKKFADVTLKALTAVLLALALALTFTVSDYYIFNRISISGGEGSFSLPFALSQWVKKSGYLLIPLAVFYKKRSCADVAKYVLPAFIILSAFTYGDFFDVTMLTANASPADKVYASINEFIPPAVNKILFFAACGAELLICVMLFVRDGFKIKRKSFAFLPLAFFAVTPLNIFENFFDISNFTRDDFLWFKNFTLWHFLALGALVAFTVSAYFILKKKSPESQKDYLAATAMILLIQYHSKDSMVMGDGYNVYHTVFACIPLFICNIGVYVASFSVFFKKRVLYAISFFVHAAGALTVFVYFGKDDMSNYGIFCSYSILYFCLTHCLLFALSVLPSALGHYKFRMKDCIIPLAYYCVVIIIAAAASGIVSSASQSFSYDGYVLQESEWLTPNYAFTQINPVPVTLPEIPFTIWKCQFNLLYLIILYLVYVALFFIFIGGYYEFLLIKQSFKKEDKEETNGVYTFSVSVDGETVSETAITEEELRKAYKNGGKEKKKNKSEKEE